MNATKPCENCGTLFRPVVRKDRAQRFCCEKCFREDEQKRCLILCAYCGIAFKRERVDRRFCAQSCATKHAAALRKELAMQRTEKQCYTCKVVKALAEFRPSKQSRDEHEGICIECARDYEQQWRDTHKDRTALYEARRDPNHLRSVKALYREMHRKLINERSKGYTRRWRERHRDEVLARRRLAERARWNQKISWQFSHQDEVRLYRRLHSGRTRARRWGCRIEPVTRNDIDCMYESQGGKCYYCRIELQHIYDIDHKVPLSRGGSHSVDNLALACALCNGMKHNKTAEEFFRVIRC